mgnify:CR=1 FL=1
MCPVLMSRSVSLGTPIIFLRAFKLRVSAFSLPTTKSWMSNMPTIISDKSPDSKRRIAQGVSDNDATPAKEQAGRRTNLNTKDVKLVDAVHTLAANLNRAIDALKAKRDPRGSNAGLASVAKVSSNTVGRARRGDGSITLVKLNKIARALGYNILQLLAPNLDATDPPEVVSDPDEKHLLRSFRRRGNGDRTPTTH